MTPSHWHESARQWAESLRLRLQPRSPGRLTATVTAGLDLQATLEQIAAEASRIAHCEHVKLLLVDKDFNLVGLITIKDINKMAAYLEAEEAKAQ